MCCLNGSLSGITLVKITDRLSISFGFDRIGIIFIITTLILFLLSGIFSIEYMKEKENKKRYFSFYIILAIVLVLMGMASNLLTFYMCYELMTLTSVPLVMHDRTKESVKAGVKYLIYSFIGAYMALYGFFVLNSVMDTLDFEYGKSLSEAALSGQEEKVLFAVFLMIVGFGVKAGMWPMHGWLPTAHPVAPGPASAVLSGMIVKAGVLGIIRVVFYLAGTDFIKESWVWYTWISLTLVTVFLGSMMAYKEKLLKRRLAYSTVSQVSYILFGLSLLNERAYEGALLQFSAHAFAKCALFLIAGALIFMTGKTGVEDFKGIGKKYPLLMWCYIISSLSLIGIPPTGGFIAKWYLCLGAFSDESLGFFSILGPVILIISALLTAGYLLPMGLKAFMPGEGYKVEFKGSCKTPKVMVIPVVLLTFLVLLVGILPNLFL